MTGAWALEEMCTCANTKKEKHGFTQTVLEKGPKLWKSFQYPGDHKAANVASSDISTNNSKLLKMHNIHPLLQCISSAHRRLHIGKRPHPYIWVDYHGLTRNIGIYIILFLNPGLF